jgi:hypothetical protein
MKIRALSSVLCFIAAVLAMQQPASAGAAENRETTGGPIAARAPAAALPAMEPEGEPDDEQTPQFTRASKWKDCRDRCFKTYQKCRQKSKVCWANKEACHRRC